MCPYSFTAFSITVHQIRAVCAPTLSLKMWGNTDIFKILSHGLRYSREKEFYKIGEIVKIAPKNKLIQKTHFPDLILTLLSIVLY